MKVKTKKSAAKNAATKKVRSNSIVRTRAFIYDLHAKCNNNSRIKLNDMVVYHKCGNNITSVMRDRYYKRIKVTSEDSRGITWIGPEPNENIVQSLHAEVTRMQRMYLNQYLAKKSNEKAPTLEFVFDDEVPEMVPATVDADSENRIQEFNQLQKLIKKFFGV